MKVLLINPPYRESTYTSPPLGIAYIASVLRGEGHEARILDCPALGLDYGGVKKAVGDMQPDVIGITAMTPVIKEAIETARAVKSVSRVPVVLGGPHASIMPGETLRNVREIDFVARSEGEMVMKEFLKAMEGGKDPGSVRGISLRKGKGIIHNPDMPLIEDLDSIPFPARDLLPMGRYRQHIGHPNSFATMITTRGCPFQCIYCLDPSTEIRTNKGNLSIKKIVDSKNEFKVLTHKGRFKGVLKKFRHAYNGEILVIKPYCLDTEIKITPNHKIFAFKKKEIKNCPVAGKCTPYRFAVNCHACSKKWYEQYVPRLVKGEELENGDFIMIPITRELNNKKILKISDVLREEIIRRRKRYGIFPDELAEKIYNLSKKGLSTRKIAKELGISKSAAHNYVKYGNTIYEDIISVSVKDGYARYRYGKKYIPNNIPITKDFLRLAGYYLAEGCVSFSKSRPNSSNLSFTFNEKETEYIKDVASLIQKMFGLPVNRINIKKDKVTRLTVSSGILGRFFSNLFGSNSLTMRIPYEFLFLPPEMQGALITGLFRGDGSKLKDSYSFYTASKDLKESVQEILIRLGIIPSIYVMKKDKYKQYKHDLHMILVLGYDLERLQKIMGFEHEHVLKRNRAFKLGFIYDDCILIPIKKIERKQYEGLVYNLEVEGDHSYVANGIAVGNCTKKVFGRLYRARSPENIVREMEDIISRYRVKEIVFYDDTFTVRRERVMKLCRLMISMGIRVKWKCEARADLVDQELLDTMAEAGCYVIAYGVESGNPNLLKTLKKGITKEQIKRAFLMAKKAGMETLGYFMIGIPGETRETVRQTLDFAIRLDPDYAQFSITTPYPQTELYRMAKNRGFLTEQNWEKYSYFGDSATPVMRTEELSTEELKEQLKRITKSFYIRRRYVLKQLFRSGSAHALRRNVSGLRAVLRWTR